MDLCAYRRVVKREALAGTVLGASELQPDTDAAVAAPVRPEGGIVAIPRA
jgi:hypothetical protein